VPTYVVYGLTLRSEIELPELTSGPQLADDIRADVTIGLGTLTGPPPTASQLPLGLWRDHASCGVEVPDVARYEARGGNEVIVDPSPGVDARAVRLYLLGTVMGAVMMQRGHLVLHGNAFRVGDASAVVVGHSGAGKSTLAAELHRRGLDVLSDDVVPVDTAGRALPGYPRIKLWEDAITRLGLSTDDLERVDGSAAKFNLPITRSDFGPLPLRWIYSLEKDAGTTLRIENVVGLQAFDLLNTYTYRRELVHDAAAAQQHLVRCAALAEGARLSRVLRPELTMSAEATADAILADINADQPGQQPEPSRNQPYKERV
jgi:hypothetical protein